MSAVYVPGAPCPCGCGATGSKLSFKSGHVARSCGCVSCRNTRNVKRGKRGEARRHRTLGGTGYTPRDDLHHSYSINVTTEDKNGAQIPRKFVEFVGSETARHWFHQAEKKLPVGSDAFPSLYLEITEGQTYLLVKLSGKGLR